MPTGPFSTSAGAGESLGRDALASPCGPGHLVTTARAPRRLQSMQWAVYPSVDTRPTTLWPRAPIGSHSTPHQGLCAASSRAAVPWAVAACSQRLLAHHQRPGRVPSPIDQPTHDDLRSSHRGSPRRPRTNCRQPPPLLPAHRLAQGCAGTGPGMIGPGGPLPGVGVTGSGICDTGVTPGIVPWVGGPCRRQPGPSDRRRAPGPRWGLLGARRSRRSRSRRRGLVFLNACTHLVWRRRRIAGVHRADGWSRDSSGSRSRIGPGFGPSPWSEAYAGA